MLFLLISLAFQDVSIQMEEAVRKGHKNAQHVAIIAIFLCITLAMGKTNTTRAKLIAKYILKSVVKTISEISVITCS